MSPHRRREKRAVPPYTPLPAIKLKARTAGGKWAKRKRKTTSPGVTPSCVILAGVDVVFLQRTMYTEACCLYNLHPSISVYAAKATDAREMGRKIHPLFSTPILTFASGSCMMHSLCTTNRLNGLTSSPFSLAPLGERYGGNRGAGTPNSDHSGSFIDAFFGKTYGCASQTDCKRKVAHMLQRLKIPAGTDSFRGKAVF